MDNGGKRAATGQAVSGWNGRALRPQRRAASIRADAPEAAEAVAGVVSRCLAKRRDERWPRALDLRTAIEELVTAAPAAA